MSNKTTPSVTRTRPGDRPTDQGATRNPRPTREQMAAFVGRGYRLPQVQDTADTHYFYVNIDPETGNPLSSAVEGIGARPARRSDVPQDVTGAEPRAGKPSPIGAAMDIPAGAVTARLYEIPMETYQAVKEYEKEQREAHNKANFGDRTPGKDGAEMISGPSKFAPEGPGITTMPVNADTIT